jgi:chromosome segregation ATPase
MEGKLTATVNIELDKAKKDVQDLQKEIKKLEDQILETRNVKLVSSDNTKAVATYNKELQALSIQLKEKRLALTQAASKVKEQTAVNREAAKAQQEFTKAVTTSKEGVEAINSVLAKYPSSTQATSESLEALKNRLIELRRLRFNEILNPQDQKLLARQIFETTNEIRDQKTALAQLARDAKIAEQASKKLSTAQQQFRNQAGASNAVALEFNRIIQDAPFGIIGIGNNIQQLAGQFSQLSSAGKSTGVILKESLSAIISPANLVLLGISAVTSAFTAYQLGAFDFIFANESATKSIDDLAKSTKSATANSAAELVKIQSLKTVIEDETKSRVERNKAVDTLIEKYPNLFTNNDREKLLNGELIKSYELLTKAIIQRAKANIAEQELPDLVKKKELTDARLSALRQELQVEESLLQTRNKLTPISQTFSGSDYEQAQRRIKGLKDEIDTLDLSSKGLKINIDGYSESIISYAQEFEDLFKNGKTSADSLKESIIDLDIQAVEFLNNLKSESQKSFEGLASGLENSLKNELNVVQKKLAQALIAGDEKSVPELKARLDQIKKLLATFSTDVKNIPIDLSGIGGLGGDSLGRIEEINAEIEKLTKARAATLDPTRIAEYTKQIKELQLELKTLTGSTLAESVSQVTKALGDAFTAMAQQIAASLNISNDSLKAFVGTLLTQTPKIIGAIYKTVLANKAASETNTKLTLKQSLANGIFVGTEGAKALGPIGLALLPVFVGGAMALISGAFRKAGVNAPGGGVGGTASRAASANTVGTSITGSGQAFNPFGDMQLRTVIRGTNIELLLERVAQEKRA